MIAVSFGVDFLIRKLSRRHNGHSRRWRAAKRLRKKIISANMSPTAMISYLRKIDPYTFEELVLLSFKKAGYRIYRNRRYSRDGGIDGRIRKKGKTWLIQCKRYSKAISPAHVADLRRICISRRVSGVFVHTGRTGGTSRTAAYGDVTFVSGTNLWRLIVLAEDVLC